MATRKGTPKFNREQIRYIMDSLATAEGKQPVEELAKKLGTHYTTLYEIKSGRTPYYRPWVAEWVAEQQQNGKHTPVLMHVKHARFTDAERKVIQEKFASGMTTGAIAKAMGMSKGSVYVMTTPERWAKYVARLAVDKEVGRTVPARASKSAPKAKLAARTVRSKREEDWGQNFRAYVEAEEEKARAELAGKHEAEREELEESLATKRQTVVDRLLEMYTKPVSE